MKQFQSFRLDTSDECLWRDGQRLALTRKAFAVLNYMVEQAGHLVTKEELMEAVWPETFVQEEILKTYVRKLRQTLGDNAEGFDRSDRCCGDVSILTPGAAGCRWR